MDGNALGLQPPGVTFIRNLPTSSPLFHLHFRTSPSCPDGGIGRHDGLKIRWPVGPCGFKSRSGYKLSPVLAGLSGHFEWSVCHASRHIVFNTSFCRLCFSFSCLIRQYGSKTAKSPASSTKSHCRIKKSVAVLWQYGRKKMKIALTIHA